jgi:hypothetical protein
MAQGRNREKVVRDIKDGGPPLAVQASEQIQNFRLCDGIKNPGHYVREQ